MSDLVKRLHSWGNFGYGNEASKTMHEAADRIDALEAENKALREALEKIARHDLQAIAINALTSGERTKETST